MQSRNADYSPEVDQLRLLAAAIVFAFHYFHTFFGGWKAGVAPRWFALVSEGYTGVSLFFVLSGYIFMVIGRKAGGSVPYGPFLMNRVLRIAPLHLTIVLLPSRSTAIPSRRQTFSTRSSPTSALRRPRSISSRGPPGASRSSSCST